MSKKLYVLCPSLYNWDGIKSMWVLADNPEEAIRVARTAKCNDTDLLCRMEEEYWFSDKNEIYVEEVDFSQRDIIVAAVHDDPAYMGRNDYVDEAAAYNNFWLDGDNF